MLHLDRGAVLNQGVANCYDTVINKKQSTADVAVRW